MLHRPRRGRGEDGAQSEGREDSCVWERRMEHKVKVERTVVCGREEDLADSEGREDSCVCGRGGYS